MSSVRLAALAALLGCASLWVPAANAQVYRITGPDGRVTFSDRPPPDGKATPAPAVAMPSAASALAGALPTELRTPASRFPVVLYTGADCAICITARNLLIQRGVPYTERTVTTNEDIAALQRLSGAQVVPFATIGGQHVRGFSSVEWSEYLDAAGYPKTSQLPPTYRNPPPTPLVAAQTPAAAAAGEGAPQAPARAEVPRPSGPSPDNPAGIRF